ncbi:sulfurtransferase Alvin_2599 [Rubritalea halochordaticola]|uniref:Sulfurtransferase Alvin_2599 n=1 Tax=Rubritalea halochordaticola TaxID=714537 RepID=A0ABP9UY50_9BACT
MASTIPDPQFTNELSVQRCRELLASPEAPLLIDCREIHEYEFCRLDQAVLVPLSLFQGNAEAEIPASDTPVIIYCHHGVRSLHATFYLRDQGYSHVFSMQGGIDAWSVEIDPAVPRY